jgi:hypothetical protein
LGQAATGVAERVTNFGSHIFSNFKIIYTYILLLNSPQALENNGFIAVEFFLIVSLVLYLLMGYYEL